MIIGLIGVISFAFSIGWNSYHGEGREEEGHGTATGRQHAGSCEIPQPSRKNKTGEVTSAAPNGAIGQDLSDVSMLEPRVIAAIASPDVLDRLWTIIDSRKGAEAPSTCQVGLAGRRPLAVGIGVYCQPILQISAQTRNFWVLKALCSAAVT
jgi:hypothetical protein